MTGLELLLMAALTAAELPSPLRCTAEQTAGLHDYPHNEQTYEPVVFFESSFLLEVNAALTRHLAGDGADLFVTLAGEDDDDLQELRCVQVRGSADTPGLSCTNDPPAQLLLINLNNLRFTRTSIGGWTFAGDSSAGDSIFVEYGVCQSE